MKKTIMALALLPVMSAVAAEGDLCPISSGQMVTKFTGTINDGTGDTLISDGAFNLRVPSNLPIKFSGGLNQLGIGQQVKFNTTYQDANSNCIATKLEARPASTSGTGGSKLRGGDSSR